jgi:hypothetical protein
MADQIERRLAELGDIMDGEIAKHQEGHDVLQSAPSVGPSAKRRVFAAVAAAAALVLGVLTFSGLGDRDGNDTAGAADGPQDSAQPALQDRDSTEPSVQPVDSSTSCSFPSEGMSESFLGGNRGWLFVPTSASPTPLADLVDDAVLTRLTLGDPNVEAWDQAVPADSPGAVVVSGSEVRAVAIQASTARQFAALQQDAEVTTLALTFMDPPPDGVAISDRILGLANDSVRTALNERATCWISQGLRDAAIGYEALGQGQLDEHELLRRLATGDPLARVVFTGTDTELNAAASEVLQDGWTNTPASDRVVGLGDSFPNVPPEIKARLRSFQVAMPIPEAWRTLPGTSLCSRTSLGQGPVCVAIPSGLTGEGIAIFELVQVDDEKITLFLTVETSAGSTEIVLGAVEPDLEQTQDDGFIVVATTTEAAETEDLARLASLANEGSLLRT